MAYLFLKVTLYPGDSVLGAWRPAVSTLGSQPFSTCIASLAAGGRPPFRKSPAPLVPRTWAPLPRDFVSLAANATPIPWEYYMRPLGGGSTVTSPKDKIAHVSRELELLLELATRRPLYTCVSATGHGPRHPHEMLTYGVGYKYRQGDQILFSLTPALGPTSGPRDAFDPLQGGLLVRCTIAGTSRVFVHQYGSPLVRGPSPKVLNTKVGALSLLTREGPAGSPLLEGCSYTLNGTTIKYRLLQGVGEHDMLFRVFKSLLEEEGISGWTFYTHQLATVYSGFLWGLLASIHNARAGQWLVEAQVNKDGALSGFVITSRTDPKFKVTFADSHKIWPADLAEVAATIGLAPKPLPTNPASQIRAMTQLQYSAVQWLNQHLYSDFDIQITESLSLPGMAMKLYLSKHLPADVYFTTGPTAFFDMLRKAAYTGGLVHIGTAGHVFEVVYAYDITSMYPSQMKSCPMPGGDATWVSGIPPLNDPLCFGWIEAVVRAPHGLHPCLLPIRARGLAEGNLCVTHSQPFAGLFFSEELKAAIKMGYEVETFGGYMFDRVTGAFTSYVDTLAQQRQDYKLQDKPGLAAMTKQLLNGLYGRFGMGNAWPKASIIAAHYESNRNIKLGSSLETKGTLVLTQATTGSANTSLPVAVATAAYARVAMAKFINLPGNPLIYSDTDSVILERPLSAEQEAQFVSTPGEAGKLKFEGRWTEFAVISAKNYTYLDQRGVAVLKTAGGKYPDLTHAAIIDRISGLTSAPLRANRVLAGKLDRATSSYGPAQIESKTLFDGVSTNPVPLTNEIYVSGSYNVISSRLQSYIADPSLIPERLKVHPTP